MTFTLAFSRTYANVLIIANRIVTLHARVCYRYPFLTADRLTDWPRTNIIRPQQSTDVHTSD